MRHYLVVANRTLDSPALEEWVARRLAEEPVHVHLVVPTARAEGRIRWAEEEARDNARRRLRRARHRLRALGALVGGGEPAVDEIGGGHVERAGPLADGP